MDPVRTDAPDYSGIDPTLDSCCRREVESNRRHTALETTLRRHDRIALAERRRRHVVDGLSFGEGCRCCYDPGSDGGEYGALVEARARMTEEVLAGGDGEEEVGEREEERGRGDTGASSEPGLGSVTTKLTVDSEDDSDDDSEFDYLLDEDLPGGEGGGGSAIANMEEERRAQLEMAALQAQGALQHGFGCHRQMHPGRVLHAAGLGLTQRGFSSVATVAPAVVLHLYDPESEMSASLDLYLESEGMAGTYRGTKFLRGSGRTTLLMNTDLADQVLPRIRPDSPDLPALVAIRDGAVVAYRPILGGGLGTESDGTIEPRAVEEFLDHAGVLQREAPAFEDLCRIRPEEMMLLENMAGERATMAKAPAEPEDFYNCGVEGCNKTFQHDHVGVRNEQQEGRLVSEEETLGRDD